MEVSVHQTLLLKLDQLIPQHVAMIIPCLELLQWTVMMTELYRLLQLVQVRYIDYGLGDFVSSYTCFNYQFLRFVELIVIHDWKNIRKF